ncbi:dihydrodipicolinate synthase family protein, partial [Escherichia coli]|uniref:dihydrodipicolinate synthase family protein n=1 Tax=Escherichia coli TaxID=562 RepID=UPI00191530CD
GADGAILLSAHLETDTFASIRTLLRQGKRDLALTAWQSVVGLTRLLFAEPSPAPAKHWLWRQRLIDSPEVRLPMVEVSEDLATCLDAGMERRAQLLLPA